MKITLEFNSWDEFVAFSDRNAEEPEPIKEVTRIVPGPGYTLEQVRAIVTAKSTDGFKDQIKDFMLNEFQTSKLPALDPKHYDRLVAFINSLNK